MISGICLVIACLLGTIGCLAVFKARLLPLFFVAVAATELGHFATVPALILAAISPKTDALGLAAAAISIVSAALLFMPSLHAAAAAEGIRRKMAAAFGTCESPFKWTTLFRLPPSHSPISRRLVVENGSGTVSADFFPAVSPTPAPLVISLHGGGWMAGNSTEFAGWNRWLADRGYAVASVDYRLVPNAAWPDQRQDALDTINYLRARADEFAIDPDRVFLLGRSAGGQIASTIAADEPPPWIRGCICLYSPLDMFFSYKLGRDDDILRSRSLLRNYLGGSPHEQSESYRQASAYLTAGRGSAPFLLLHGLRDELVWFRQSERFSRRLDELEVRNAYVPLPWGIHAFDYNIHGPGGQAAAACIRAFLANV